MKTRTLSSIFGGAILGIILYAGGAWVIISCMIISIISTYEALKLTPHSKSGALTYIFVIVFMISALVSPDITKFMYLSSMIIVMLVIACALYTVSNSKEQHPYKMLAYSIGLPIYSGFLFSHALLLYQATSLPTGIGLKILLLTIIGTFTTDTGAYIFGSLFGKIKIAPTISINKTLEGSIGGFVSGVIITVAIGSLIQIPATLAQITILGIAIGVSAQIGDLFESKLKRIMNTKESGTFMPGHGGLLDRIDGLLITLPISYYIFWAIS